MSSVTKLTRIIKWAAIVLGSLIALVVMIRIGVMLTGVSPEWVAKAGHSARHSPVLMVIRYLLYVCVWLCWKPMVKHYMPDANDELIKSSRKILLILIALYEVMCWIRFFS